MEAHISIDLGASSGRVVLVKLADGRVTIEEVHRFANHPVDLLGALHWPAAHLQSEVMRGLAAAASAARNNHCEVASVAVDSWGVDFGLLGPGGQLLGLPRCYRDPSNHGALAAAVSLVPRERFYAETGVQVQAINSVFQLFAEKLRPGGPELLALASSLLFTPGLVTYWLTGERVNERCMASTSGMYDSEHERWTLDLLATLGLPVGLLGDVVAPGTKVGLLAPGVADATGLDSRVPVIATASHDSAAALAAIPATAANWAFLSCGTWSVVGVELPRPVRSADACAAGFTNELALNGTRLLANVVGLWVEQECKRVWAGKSMEIGHAQGARLAAEARPSDTVVDLSAPRFASVGDAPTRLREYCLETGQTPPGSPGETLRTVLKSLATEYRIVLDDLERVTSRRIEVLYAVGGGTQNELLMQFAANATGRPVLVGPTEATAVGNALVQALALGRVRSQREMRELVGRSSEPVRYEPAGGPEWSAALDRLRALRALRA